MNLADILKKSDKKAKKKNAAKVVAGLGIGAVAGVLAGTLLAPKAGKETREDLAKGAKETLEKAKDSVYLAKEKISRTLEEKKANSSEYFSESEDVQEEEEVEENKEEE